MCPIRAGIRPLRLSRGDRERRRRHSSSRMPRIELDLFGRDRLLEAEAGMIHFVRDKEDLEHGGLIGTWRGSIVPTVGVCVRDQRAVEIRPAVAKEI